MTRPTVSATAEDLYASLGAWSAFDGEASDWVVLHMCEALVGPGRLDDINVLCRDDISVNPPVPGWSTLLDIDETPDNAVDWLGQLVGTRADPDLSTIDNRAFIKSTPTWRRGTLDAVVAVAKLYLTGPKLIEVHERDTSPYHATVRLYSDEVAGATYAELQVEYPTIAAFEAAFARYSDIPSTGRVIQRILTVKPAGIVLDVVIGASASYAAIQASYPTIPEFEAALATYPDCAAFRPPGDIFTIGA